MDRRIKFRHLDAFSTIARTGRLKRAAEALNLTQPAISRTLKELEEITGTPLMERSRAGIRLTPEGEVFLQFAEQSTSALRQGLRSLQATGVAAGQLRVGALPSVAASLIPQSIVHFADRYPDVRVEIHEGTYRDLVGRLRGGGLELVVGRLGQPDTMEGLTFRQLYTEEVVVVCRPDSPARSIRRFEDLAAFRVVYPPKETAIRPLVARHLISLGVGLYRNRIESASSAFGRAVTLADPGTVWFISRGVVSADLADGRLTCLDLNTDATLGAVGIISRAEEIPTAAVQAFVRALTAASS